MTRFSMARCGVALALFVGLAPLAHAQHFDACSFNTGSNASVIVQPGTVELDGAEVSPGVELAVFTSGGLCAGVAVWQGETIAITVWGDDPITSATDGMLVGEPLSFRAYDPITGVEFRVVSEIVYSSAKPHYTPHGLFVEHGIYVVDRLVLDVSGSDEENGKTVSTEQTPRRDASVTLFPNYPNPFNPSTTISYSLAEGTDLQIRILNVLGQTLLELSEGWRSSGTHSVSVDLGDSPSGLYLYQIRTAVSTETRSMTLSR